MSSYPAFLGISLDTELMPTMATRVLASGSPGNNPRVPTQDEIIELYKRVYA